MWTHVHGPSHVFHFLSRSYIVYRLSKCYWNHDERESLDHKLIMLNLIHEQIVCFVAYMNVHILKHTPREP